MVTPSWCTVRVAPSFSSLLTDGPKATWIHSQVFPRTSNGLRRGKTKSVESSDEPTLMPYLLDTDTCIYALKHDAGVIEQLLSKSREEIIVSVISEAELRTGAAKSSTPTKTLRLVENFLRPLAIAEFTSDDAIAYAHVRSKLERAGTPIGPLDTLIAGQAVARELILVSNNEREFKRVSGLHVENWRR